MHRGILLHCLPWLLLVIGLLVAARLLIAISGSRRRVGRLRLLHQDQGGAVQTLSFVLTLPVFIMLLMLIVQASQLMIGQMVVEYAAVAAARSAMVWIPAMVTGGNEWENCISSYSPDSDQSNTNGGTRYIIQPTSPKYQKILSAAVLACARSRRRSRSPVRGRRREPWSPLCKTLTRPCHRPLPAIRMIPTRLSNKLAYSQNNTTIKLTFVHKSVEPPLATWDVPPDIGEFYFNEVGWQDSLSVTVYHRLALLPGPGRLLFGTAASSSGQSDTVAPMIQQSAAPTFIPSRRPPRWEMKAKNQSLVMPINCRKTSRRIRGQDRRD